MAFGTEGVVGLGSFRFRERAIGMFGELLVCDEDACRSLWCDAQCLGSLYLEPDGEPGPIPESPYVLGWMAAVGPRGQSQRVLMGGLGCGAGVMTIFHHRPDTFMTVVEIDPVVVDVARRHFPELGKLEASGKLQIIEAAIEEWLLTTDACWEVALLDCYAENADARCDGGLLNLLRTRADSVWLNVVDDERGTRSRQWVDAFRANGWVAQTVMPMLRQETDGAYFFGNIILGSDIICTVNEDLYSDRQDANARDARAIYHASVAAAHDVSGGELPREVVTRASESL
jgi:hypothetical protein